ncbi:hypothetical protein [Streptomyces sp. KL116D]|uniref:hypothetical protein n=1 Tax=Streptomyces sp. KL116D TaxID=3045152 RepID=UPI003558994E
MAVVSAGGLLAALAPNLPVLLLSRVLQGVMVGALPLSFILVRRHLPQQARRWRSVWSWHCSPAAAWWGRRSPGPISEGLSWHWMFALPTIVIVAATLVPDPADAA